MMPENDLGFRKWSNQQGSCEAANDVRVMPWKNAFLAARRDRSVESRLEWHKGAGESIVRSRRQTEPFVRSVSTISNAKEYPRLPARLQSMTFWESSVDEQTKIEIEAAAFRGLVEHLQRRSDVQNIDLMNLAGFCRNCLSKWYMNAAAERGVAMSYDQAREAIYGMSYQEWKTQYQQNATTEQMRKFEETQPLHAFVSGHGGGS
jgi:uncharacterized protein